ncbi:MAG: 16S rRNA (guanine1516-N2)-methyltransferase [Planctomycetota bacterium]
MSTTSDIDRILSTQSAVDVTRNDYGVEITNTQGLKFSHSFMNGPYPRRARQSNQALLKACQNKQRNIHSILDLTGGWGVDSFILAHHGQQVHMIEQNPLLWAIVAQSLSVLQENSPALAARLSSELCDGLSYLRTGSAEQAYDCIYIDPMFPAHKSSAKPGKELQILQSLTDNSDIEACFQLALEKAVKRVVVKRPAKASSLDGKKPDIIYREKTIRFDVYLSR